MSLLKFVHADADKSFENGLKLLDGGKPGAGAEIFASLLEKCVERYGEKGKECVAVYCAYAECLLREVEMSSDPLGGQAGTTAEQEDEAPDAQIAWECLEVARVIIEEQPAYADRPSDLTSVFVLLAECGMELGLFDKAREDLEAAKRHLGAVGGDTLRRRAEVETKLGTCCSHQAGSEKEEAAKALRAAAVAHFEAAAGLVEEAGKALEEKARGLEGEDAKKASEEAAGLTAVATDLRERAKEEAESERAGLAELAEAIKDTLAGASGSGTGAGAGAGAREATAAGATTTGFGEAAVAKAVAAGAEIKTLSVRSRKRAKPADGEAGGEEGTDQGATGETGSGAPDAKAARAATDAGATEK